MCTRFVYNGDDIISGFNFEIDLTVWNHKIIMEEDKFYIGIKGPDGRYHSYHGVNQNGNVGTLLYVHGNPHGIYQEGSDFLTIADLTEQYIQGLLTFDEARILVKSKKIVYAPDATMQAMLSDAQGRVLIIEPGIGSREEKSTFSLITNASLLNPESTRSFLIPGDHRYDDAKNALNRFDQTFSASNALKVLCLVKQDEPWATRVSFVYSQKEKNVYYVENNDFDRVLQHKFSS